MRDQVSQTVSRTVSQTENLKDKEVSYSFDYETGEWITISLDELR